MRSSWCDTPSARRGVPVGSIAGVLLSALLAACIPRPPVLAADPVAEQRTPAGVVRWQQLLQDGDVAQRAGRGDDALLNYLLAEQWLAQTKPLPPDVLGDEILWRIALLHEAAGRWSAASDVWSLAAGRTDRRGENLQRLGWARFRLHRYLEAREAFTAALIHNPSHTQARLGLALVAEALGDWALATQHLDEVLHLDSQLQSARLARVRVALQQADLVTARQQLRVLLQQGATPETYTLMGDLLAREGDYARALQAYTKHLALHESWARLGHQAMREQDYARAIRYFEQAAKESPTYLEELQKQRAIAEEWQSASLTP